MSSNPVLVNVLLQGLFGRFDHQVQFPEDRPFAIVIGPNGVGKTRLFEIIRGATTGRATPLFQSPFDALTLSYSDGAVLRYLKLDPQHFPEGERSEPEQLREQVLFESSDLAFSPYIELSVVLPDGDLSTRILHPLETSESMERLQHLLPLRRLGGGLWRDHAYDDVVEANVLLERYRDELGSFGIVQDQFEGLEPYIADSKSYLIETQRLYSIRWSNSPSKRGRAAETTSTVLAYSDALKHQLEVKLAESGSIAQRLDRTFPNRLLNEEVPTQSEEEIRRRYEEQVQFRKRLEEIGVLDMGAEVDLPITLDLNELKVMMTYLDDSDEKLGVFAPVLDRIDLMRKIINEKFLFKSLRIGGDSGLKTFGEDGEEISLGDLSSGEQHELVLLYDLLFNVEPGSLVMIDEPELSLHVAWQRRFLDDLGEVAKVVGVRFLIATHSPQIIDRWWSHTNELAKDWQ